LVVGGATGGLNRKRKWAPAPVVGGGNTAPPFTRTSEKINLEKLGDVQKKGLECGKRKKTEADPNQGGTNGKC